MKRFLLTGALLAATLAPVAAQAQDHRWNDRDRREWRQDRRDDWRAWRQTHRNDYRRRSWRAPFTYRRFAVGVVAPRNYWGAPYYVSNWRAYRQPALGSLLSVRPPL